MKYIRLYYDSTLGCIKQVDSKSTCMIDNYNIAYIFNEEVFKHIPIRFSKSPYVVTNENVETADLSLLRCGVCLGLTGRVTLSKIEHALLCNNSDYIIDIYSSKYADKNSLGQFMKPYGSPWHVKSSVIETQNLRNDKREFGLKYALKGIYKDLTYFDFHNFYPNIMLELGCPQNFDRNKFIELLNFGDTKFTLNKIIGRFDTEYSIFYDREYANLLRRFGRLKLLHYIFKTDQLILCNTDSILAKVSENFKVPENTTSIKVDNAIINNVGNYILQSGDEYIQRGLFRKSEELVIAKERMGLHPCDDEFKLSNLFGSNEQGYLSASETSIEHCDHRCKYGKSLKLFRKPLVEIQEIL